MEVKRKNTARSGYWAALGATLLLAVIALLGGFR